MTGPEAICGTRCSTSGACRPCPTPVRGPCLPGSSGHGPLLPQTGRDPGHCLLRRPVPPQPPCAVVARTASCRCPRHRADTALPAAVLPLMTPRCPCAAKLAATAAMPPPPLPLRYCLCCRAAAAAVVAVLPPPPLRCCRHCHYLRANTATTAALLPLLPPSCHRCRHCLVFILVVAAVAATSLLPPKPPRCHQCSAAALPG